MGGLLGCGLFDAGEIGLAGFVWLRGEVGLLELQVLVGEVKAMQARELFEVRVEVGDRSAATEFDQDVVFDGGKDGEQSCAGSAAMESLGEYAGQFGVGFEFAMGGVEAAERGG